MSEDDLGRRSLAGSGLGLIGAVFTPPLQAASRRAVPAARAPDQVTFTRMPAPAWLLAFWREIDDKSWGAGFDCLAEHAVCNLGVADWHGREAIRAHLRAFVDTGFTAHHEVLEYWDSPRLKVFRGTVRMTPDDAGHAVVTPTMTHFFYMDEADPTKVAHWYGAVGPVAFG